MSTQSINSNDYKTAIESVDNFIAESSMDILKNIRFGVGKIDHSKMREILRLKGVLERVQKIEKHEQKEEVFSEVIRKSILLGNEL